MKRRGTVVLCGVLLGLVGCGGGSTSGDGAATGADLSGGGGGDDLAGSDLAGVSTDMAIGANQMEVNWTLLTANIQGGTNNGYSDACDAAGVMFLKFTVTNPAQTSATTMAPCVGSNSNGMAVLTLPDTVGPYTMSGVAVGKPMSVGEKIANIMPGANPPTLRIYVEGCDQPICM